MKTPVLLLSLAASLASLHAQGTVDFTNIKISGRPRIIDPQTGQPAGPDWLINILFKNPSTGNYEPASKNGLPFAGHPMLSGVNAGLFNGGVLVVPFLAPDSVANARIQAWDTRTGATFANAWAKGTVDVQIDRLGGAGLPPSLPAILPDFRGMVLIPEPSTLALGITGTAALLTLRRRRRD